MKAPVDVIGTHTGTGASTTHHKLGKEGVAGLNTDDIGSTTRLIAITGVFSGTLKIEGSLDESNWFDWITGVTSPSLYIINDGPLFLRSNCTAYTSGTATVKVQKFIEA